MRCSRLLGDVMTILKMRMDEDKVTMIVMMTMVMMVALMKRLMLIMSVNSNNMINRKRS